MRSVLPTAYMCAATCILTTCVLPRCELPTCALPTCVLPICILPICVLPTSVLPTCVLPTCVLPTCVLPPCVRLGTAPCPAGSRVWGEGSAACATGRRAGPACMAGGRKRRAQGRRASGNGGGPGDQESGGPQSGGPQSGGPRDSDSARGGGLGVAKTGRGTEETTGAMRGQARRACRLSACRARRALRRVTDGTRTAIAASPLLT